MRPSFLFAVLLPAILTLGSFPVQAQAQVPSGGIAINQFDPTPAGDRFFSIPTPAVVGHLVPRFVGYFDYARNPLILTDGRNSGAVISDQGFMHVGVSFALWNRMLVSSSLPIALIQRGESPTIGNVRFASPNGTGVGDLRINTRIRIAGENDETFQIALGASIHAPTAPADSYAGENALRVAGEVVVGGRWKQFIWSALLRPMVRASTYPATLNHGIAIGSLMANGRLQIGLEFFGATPLQESFLLMPQGKSIARGLWSNMELHLSLRACIASRIWAGVAGGPGLSSEIGTPQFRIVGMLGWLDQCPG